MRNRLFRPLTVIAVAIAAAFTALGTGCYDFADCGCEVPDGGKPREEQPEVDLGPVAQADMAPPCEPDGGQRKQPDMDSPPPPEIVCPRAVTFPADANTCGAKLALVQLGAVVVPAGYRVEMVNLPANGLFPVGTTIIDYLVHGPGGELLKDCAQSVVVVGDTTPKLNLKSLDLYEDDQYMKEYQCKLEEKNLPILYTFDLASCVSGPIQTCGGVLDLKRAAKIDRIEFWANILTGDKGNARKETAQKQAVCARWLDTDSAKMAITSATTALLPFDEFEDVPSEATFFQVYFSLTDNSGKVSAHECRVNLFDHLVAEQRRPANYRVPLAGIACTGSGCTFPAPGNACR